MARGLNITIVLMMSSLFVTQAGDERNCFTPVVCSDDRTSKPEWHKVTSCHDSTSVKTGQKGEKGDAGLKGKVGATGPNCNGTVDAMKKEMDEIKQNMTRMLEEMKQSILASVPGSCPILHDGRCYWAVMKGRNTTNFKRAELLCRERGGRLAKIINAAHMDLMLDFARKWVDGDNNRGMWVAGKYNSTKNEADVPYVRWAAVSPSNVSSHSRLQLAFRRKPSNADGYLDKSSTSVCAGAFCENAA